MAEAVQFGLQGAQISSVCKVHSELYWVHSQPQENDSTAFWVITGAYSCCFCTLSVCILRI